MTIFSTKIIAIVAFLLIPVINHSVSANSGNAPIFDSIDISNEEISYVNSNTVLVRWETTRPATSRVMYGTKSQKTLMFGFDANRMNHGYDFSTYQDDMLTTKHKITVTGLAPNTQYFFRTESRVNNYARLGSEQPLPQSQMRVAACNYINSYMKMGAGNDTEEVLKLQTFLKNFEGFTNLKITGVFDQATFDAVSSFQAKYADDILAPWGINSPTGFVYLTTQKKINEIHCGKTIPLTKSQLDEINQFYSSTTEEPTIKNTTKYEGINFENIIKQNKEDNNSELITYDETTEDLELQASVAKTKTSWMRSIFSKFLNLFK